jgi:hypothetical protein
MLRNRNPDTGAARVTGTPERPGLSASFTSGAVSASQLAAGRLTFAGVLAP